MDHPGGSELDSSLSQPDNPCLIVEDSQPDSVVALMDQDDPDSSYRALLSRRLSSLQPTSGSHSPVLELISSPAGSRSSQMDSQLERSQTCSQSGPAVAGPTNAGPANEEESQVIGICPLPNKKIGTTEYGSLDSTADSTTHCAQSEESQFNFLELSESQGLGDEAEDVPEEKGDITVPQTDSERHSKPAEQKVDASGRRENKSTRSEVTSSSSSEPLLQSAREMRVHALLHSQGRHATEEDHQDSEVLSSQEDLFDAADKTGAGVDSTVSEMHPLTPAHSLGLLHLSGQGTLVQQSLSQSSTDYVAPSQGLLSQTPFIVPNSPTEGGPDEPMDTSLPTDDKSGSKAEGMETEAVPKPRPTASTPVSQNSPAFVLEKTLSMPSQPEFSHDVFVATQSQEAASSSSLAARDSRRKPATALLRDEKPRSSVESSPSSLSLRLTVNTESSSALLALGQSQDDSQATQIEGLDEAPGIDTSDSVMMSRCSQRSERNGVSSSPKVTTEPKAACASDSLKRGSEGARTEDRTTSSQRSQVQESTPTARNVTNVNVSPRASGGSLMGSGVEKVDALASSHVQRTPTTTARGSLASMSQPVYSQTTSRASVNVTGSALNTPSPPKRGPSSSAPSQLLSLDRDAMDEGLGDEAGEEDEEDEMMEEGQSMGPESSALGLALSQSQVLSPEPMEEEEEAEGGEEVSESERSQGLLEREDALSSSQQRRSGSSQPVGSKVPVSTNGHGSQAQSKGTCVAPESLSQTERKVPEAKGVKDKSLSDGSGETPFHFTLPKEGELIGPAVNATPPLINQLKQTPRHSSTPIDKPAAVTDVSAATTVATCDMAAAESSGGDRMEKGDGKLSLRMKVVSPMEEGSSEHFCLQKPTLSDEEGSVVKVTAVAKAVTSPSVFSRVRQVHRQLEVEEENQHDVTPSPVGRPSSGAKGEEMRTSGEDQGISSSFMTLCSTFSSQRSSLGCNSLPGSQNEVPPSPVQEQSPAPRREPSTSGSQGAAAGGRGTRGSNEPPLTPTRTPGPRAAAAGTRSPEPSTPPTRTPALPGPQAGDREVSTPTRTPAPPGPQAGDRGVSTPTRTPGPPGPQAGDREVRVTPEPSTPTRKAVGQMPESHQTSFENSNDTIILSPPSKRCQKAASQPPGLDAQGFRSPGSRGDAEMPFRRTGSGPAHRRHVRTIQEVRTTVTRIITDVYYEDGKEVERKVTEESEEPVVDCQVLDSDVSPCRTVSSLTSGDLADVSSLSSSKTNSLQRSSSGTSTSTTGGPLRNDFAMPSTSRGTSRGARGGGTSGRRGVGTPGPPQSSSEDERYARLASPPGLPDSPMDGRPPSQSDSLRSSPEAEGSAGRGGGSSLVGLRVVAKWSSNHYFYSGRITRDLGEGRFRLRFDDGYECEVLGKDILLCDPIPLETEVTALLEGEFFSIGIVKGHKTENHELLYCVEKEGNKQWHKRSTIILSLEQGNKLREQHSLGPYEPSTPLAKASDISLDNLVEGKRRRTGTPGGQSTPNHSSNSSPGPSPRTPGPSGKRKLLDDGRSTTPAKRGRRGPGSRAAQRVGVVNTSDSAPEMPGQSADLLPQTHGPLPLNTSLFMGFAFMLTASSECDRMSNKLTSDDDEEYVETAPYHRGYTEKQLEAGGGFILKDFNENQCKAAYQSLLIADQHCRTSKYLQCVASGVPCVSHMWVRDCCKDNKLLNYRNYLLPAGVGPDDSIVEWHPRAYPFKPLRVLLVFEEPVELWSQLLILSGASSVKHYQADKDSPDIPTGKFDLVITDRACPQSIQKSVMSQKLPLLSAEWLIQSLICGERQGYQSKPQYSHDYLS